MREEGFDFLGYHFGRMAASVLAAEEEPGQIQGHHPGKDPPHQREQPGGDHRNGEPDAAWLVRVLQAQLSHHVLLARRLDPDASAEHSPQTPGGKGRGRGSDHQRWPNAYFAEQGLFNLKAAHALARQSSPEVKPSTGEPDAGDPPVRFGGRGGRNQSALPTPIRSAIGNSEGEQQASDARRCWLVIGFWKLNRTLFAGVSQGAGAQESVRGVDHGGV